MCTGFTIDGICMNTMCAVTLAIHLRAVADAFRPLRLISTTERLTDELHKSEVPVIASSLLVVQAENIYRNKIEMHKTMDTGLSH